MRKLATIRKIADIRPIEGADAIECAVIDGWTVVVKKGEFERDCLCVYFEIDSWIPTEIAPFLTKDGHFPKEYNGIKGERLKTVKLRGQISQGLAIPLEGNINIENMNSFFDVIITSKFMVDSADTIMGRYETLEGIDLTALLGIQKWEKELAPQLRGFAEGSFPSEVPKTDQERCQNLVKDIQEWAWKGVEFEISEKLDGTSCTILLDMEVNFKVCSRNLSLKETDENTYWKMARKYDLKTKMVEFGLHGIAIQGEVIGEGIQGDKYKFKGQDFFVFDIYDIGKKRYLDHYNRLSMCEALGLNHVPVLYDNRLIPYSVDNLLKMAEGKSVLNGKTEREGLVFKSMDGSVSFKAISNKFLLKGGD